MKIDWQQPLWPLMKLSRLFNALNPAFTLSCICSWKFSWLSITTPRTFLDFTTFNFSSPNFMSTMVVGSFPSGVITTMFVLSAATDKFHFLHHGFTLKFKSLLVDSPASITFLWLDHTLVSSAYSACFLLSPPLNHVYKDYIKAG